MSRGYCTPEQQLECPLFEHFTDTHHLYYPASDYNKRIEREYRALPHHKVQMCRQEHNELHATTEPPTKPEYSEMVRAVASFALKEAGGAA